MKCRKCSRVVRGRPHPSKKCLKCRGLKPREYIPRSEQKKAKKLGKKIGSKAIVEKGKKVKGSFKKLRFGKK